MGPLHSPLEISLSAADVGGAAGQDEKRAALIFIALGIVHYLKRELLCAGFVSQGELGLGFVQQPAFIVGQAGPHHHLGSGFRRELDVARALCFLFHADVEKQGAVRVLQPG